MTGRNAIVCFVSLAVVLSMSFPRQSLSATLGGKMPKGFEEALGIDGDQQAQSYEAIQVESGAPANVFWPGDKTWFTLRFLNRTDQPIRAKGKVEAMQCGTRTSGTVFNLEFFKIADLGAAPIEIDLPANGSCDVRVEPKIPETFGGYVLVADIEGHGRCFAAAFVRSMPAAPGREQYPAFAIDLRDPVVERAALYSRIGVRGARREAGYCPSGTRDYDRKMDELTEVLKAADDQNITVMLTLHAGGEKFGPLGRGRPHLNDQNETIGGKTDQAWLPEYDEDFQKWVALIVGQFGWPHGPVNAVELWNEPWEALSISGWQADIPRYRDLYTRMAQGVEQARAADPTLRVLIGGCCSSTNTMDKLFCDGSDQFLKWLDFASIHYQPLGAWPSLYKSWVNRQGPNGPVRCWDTESWVANSEDRVAAVIASMRAQGQERTAGVLHDAVCSFAQLPGTAKTKEAKTYIPAAWAPAAAVGAMQNFLGQRKFKEILFKNGLPWVFVFDGLPKDGAANPDDGTVVVVGDLAGVYEHEKLLFWSVQGLSELKNAEKVKELQNRLVMLPKKDKSVREERDRVLAELSKMQTLEGAAMTMPDGGGKFILYDFYGNPQPSKDGKITVPLNDRGYFLRADGSKGSFGALLQAIQKSSVQGYEPLDAIAHDLLAPIGERPALHLTLTNILNRPVKGDLQVTLGALKLAPEIQSLEFAAHETKEVEIRISGGEADPSNTCPLALRFDAGADGEAFHEEDLHVNRIARKTIEVDGDLNDWEGALPHTVKGIDTGPNLTERAWLPMVEFDESVKTGMATGYLAYDDKAFYFAAKIADSTPYDGNIRFENRDDDSYFYPDTVTFVPAEPQPKKEVRVGKSTPSAPSTKSKKAEEPVTLTWPEGVRHFSYRKDADTPAGNKTDGVQIAFNVIPIGEDDCLPNPPGTMPRFMEYRDTDYEFALNPVAERYGGGTEMWRLFAPGIPRKSFFPRQPVAPKDGGPVEGGKIAMRREGNTRLVEAALPWSEIPDVRKRLDAGETIKFSFRVNDNDGPEYELAGNRSVSKINKQAFHNDWETSWANEVEFAFEKK